jgi:hypothetical protein
VAAVGLLTFRGIYEIVPISHESLYGVFRLNRFTGAVVFCSIDFRGSGRVYCYDEQGPWKP